MFGGEEERKRFDTVYHFFIFITFYLVDGERNNSQSNYQDYDKKENVFFSWM